MPDELDGFVDEFATPLLREHGFKKSGLHFRKKSVDGDWTLVHFLRYPMGFMASFYVSVAFVASFVKAVEEIQAVGEPTPGKSPSAAWMGPRWRSILPVRGVTWQYNSQAQRGTCGKQLQARLSSALTALHALADHDVLFDVEFAPVKASIPHARSFPDGGWERLALLAERGPSPQLTQMTKDAGRLPDSVRAWLNNRVAQPPAARGLDEYDHPTQLFRQGLAEHVDPAMTELGFAQADTGFVCRSERGDEAVVDVTVSMTTSNQACVFYVGTGVRPRLSVAFDAARSQSHLDSPHRLLWERAVVSPPRGLASRDPDVAVLGLRPWRVPIAPTEPGVFDRVATALTAAAQRVAALLDREVLHGLLDAVDTPYGYSPHPPTLARALLVADDPTHPRYRDAMLAVDMDGHGLAPQFMAWLATQHTLGS